jgi:hypothetical protein
MVALVVLVGSKWVRLVCDAQLPVITDVRVPSISSTITPSSKISKLSPNAFGLRLKYPSVGG